MSLAAETRDAVRARPFLLEALRAGIVNYAAAARTLDLGEDTDAVATALRRFAEDLPPREAEGRAVRVTMHGGLHAVEGDASADGDGVGDEGISFRVGDDGFAVDDGDLTGVLASGDVDAGALSHVLSLLHANEVDVRAAGTAGDALVVVVDRRDGATAVRLVERALDAVPTV